MDLIAEIKVMTLNVKHTAPPISIAASLPDLFELPWYNRYSPRNNKSANRTISKTADMPLIRFLQRRLLVAAEPQKIKACPEVVPALGSEPLSARHGIGFPLEELPKYRLRVNSPHL